MHAVQAGMLCIMFLLVMLRLLMLLGFLGTRYKVFDLPSMQSHLPYFWQREALLDL